MDFSKIRATWWSGNCYHIEQLNSIISSTDIKAYSYILHDKDINEDGTPKKPHYHFLVQFYTNQRGSWFKQFNSEDMGIVFIQTCYNPESAFDYQIHDTPTARKQGKCLYDPNERISTIENFEPDEKPDENTELFNDLMELVFARTNWHDFIKKQPKRIHMISNIYRSFELLFFETHGYRCRKIFPKFQKHGMKQLSKSKDELLPPKPQTTKIDFVPIPNNIDLPW